MRHNVRGRKLNRTTSHRKAMFRNMVTDLFRHERIETTTAKAKEARSVAERLITYAKAGDLNSRRMAARKMRDPKILQKLFDVLGPRYKDRPGGYTRVLKIEGNRHGDNAEMSILELVGGEVAAKPKKAKKAKVEETAVEETVTGATATEEVSTSDDLTKVEGIGPKTAEAFNAAGIHTYADLAAKETDELKAILTEASPQLARFDPDTWPRQAALAAEGKWDELKTWQDELDGGKE